MNLSHALYDRGWDGFAAKLLIRPPSCGVQSIVVNYACLFICFAVCSSSGYSYQSQTYIDQSLTSPNYPFNYPRSTTCLWSLRRLSTSYAVRLTFLSFYLESSSGCTHDYVEIRDGDLLSTSRLIGKFCGTRMPPIIVSKYKFIFVRFVSDLDYFPSTRKFHATFRAIVPGKH